MSAGYLCLACKGIFVEPDTHKSRGDVASGEGYWVIEEFCPDCGDDGIQEINICETCKVFEAEEGYDECRVCLREQAECEAEFRRDQVREVRPLTREIQP